MNERQDKKSSLMERLHIPKRVPIGIQTMLIATAALVLLGAVTVFWGAYFVNNLKNMLVEDAREAARQTAEKACEQIRSVVKSSGATSMADIVNHPDVQSELEMLSRQGAIAVAAILDEHHHVVVQQFCAGSTPSMQEDLGKGALFSPEDIIDGDDGLPRRVVSLPGNITPVEFKIKSGNETVGLILIGLVEQPSLERINRLSVQITQSLIVMVMVVFGILLVTIVVVYYAFRRQLELQARSADTEHLASVGTLASGLAHEIRNPLHAMNLHLEVALEDLDSQDFDREDTMSTLERVHKQIEHLNGIVTNFLNAASPLRMEKQEMKLDQTVREVAAFLQPDLNRHGVSMVLDLPDDMTIKGDPRAIRQVLINLILNAQKAMEKTVEKKLRIGAERTRRGWSLLVEDSGPGLKEGDECTIFKTFTAKRCGGTGFGLAIARRIMEGHGGRIGAGKAPQLGGARFWLEFPA